MVKLVQLKNALDRLADEATWVSRQKHPTEDLWIYNYTPQAQFDPEAFKHEEMRAARGLIFDGDANVVARPFEKFFNYGDPSTGPVDLDEPAAVYDKVDGSLGILYPKSSGTFAVATRGSFVSDQALHATEVWKEKYAYDWGKIASAFRGRWTFLFEIVYPENRIVLNYGDMDDLVLLGAVRNKTGRTYSPEIWEYPGPVAEAMPYTTLGEALEAPPRDNAEGFVATLWDRREPTLVKIKQEDYLRLHKLIFGLNRKTIWETLSTGGAVSDLLDQLPDEFHEWVYASSHNLLEQYQAIEMQAHYEFHEIRRRMYYDPLKYPRDARKEFAGEAVKSEYAALLFMLFDGKAISDSIWSRIKPSGTEKPFLTFNEDTA